MDNDLLRQAVPHCPYTPEQIEEAGKIMENECYDYITNRYPKISLEVFDKNLIEFSAMQNQVDACRMCVGWESCPNPDLMMLTGELTAQGWVRLYHSYCPKNYQKPKKQENETQSDYDAKRKWVKR